MNKRDLAGRVILLILITYCFLLSIKLMGGSFKMFGSGFAETLISFTANPVTGLLIGILATSVVQSSSATTSIIVGLVAGGALTVDSAIFMVMGANIGTSITNTIVSLAHITKKNEFKKAFEVATVHDFFNFIVVLILFPIEVISHPLQKMATYFTSFFLGSGINSTFKSPLDYIIKPVASSIQSYLGHPAIILVVSLLTLFVSLRYFVKVIKPLAQEEFKDMLNQHVFKTPIRSFSLGLILTMIVQSSSVSTSLIVPLAGVGLLTLNRIFPYILGANVGTTITALLAGLVTGSTAAITVALAHFLFNTIGTGIVYPIRKIPIHLSKKLASFSLRSKMIPFSYIAIVFYIIPVIVIFVLR